MKEAPAINMIEVLFRPCNVYKYPKPKQYGVPVIPGKNSKDRH